MTFLLRPSALAGAALVLATVFSAARVAAEEARPGPDAPHDIKSREDVDKLPADARVLKVLTLKAEADWAALVARAPGATSLEISPTCEVPAGAYAQIAKLTRLTVLNLSAGDDHDDRRKLPEGATEQLSKLTALQTLDLNRCDVTDANLEPLGKLANLAWLRLDGSGLASGNITDAGVQKLVPKLGKLAFLSLARQWEVGDASAAAIAANCQGLVVLNLETCHALTDKGVAELAGKLTRLEELNLTSCEQLTDEACASLAGMARLDLLRVGWSGIGDTGCERLAALSRLETLDVAGCEGISDKGLEHIARLVNLTTLVLDDSNFSGGKITDAGLKHVAKLTKLHFLSLKRRKALTDAGIAEIAGLPLKDLNLQYCDKLTDKSLQSLSGCATLEMLSIAQCKGMTAAGTAALKKCLPGCFVNESEDLDDLRD